MLVIRTVLLITIIIAVCFAGKQHVKRDDHSSEQVSENCDDGLSAFGLANPCRRSSTSTTSPMTTVKRSDWCKFGNGTTVALGYTFIHRNCTICECSPSKLFRCQAMQCLPTYCLDESRPSRREGQCCAQCQSDKSSDSCLYKEFNYPHGTVMKSIEGKMQCWCQWGHIECRQYISSPFPGADLLSDSATITLIALILVIVLFFGLLVCCSCSLIFYYYYQRHQATIQQAYDQYLNSMGWQPMEEGSEEQKQAEEYPVEMLNTAEEKEIEAEQNQYNQEQIPPPYAIFDQSYTNNKEEQANK